MDELTLEEKAVEFINIELSAKTARIAEHLSVTKKEAFVVLKELLYYGLITAKGLLIEERIDEIIWYKKEDK